MDGMKAVSILEYKMSIFPFMKMWEESSHFRGQFAPGARVLSALNGLGLEDWIVISLD